LIILPRKCIPSTAPIGDRPLAQLLQLKIQARRRLRRLSDLEPAFRTDYRSDEGGGVYPNLFDVAPPFQIDGHFRITAAIAEMLVRSENGTIYLLPALPGAWKDGKVAGLCVRGGFESAMTWNDGKLASATIRSETGEPCRDS
jgi:alpha-L-fucosidase 2